MDSSCYTVTDVECGCRVKDLSKDGFASRQVWYWTIAEDPSKYWKYHLCFKTEGTDRLPGWIKMTVSVCEF